MVVSEMSFGAYVCLRRHVGLLRDERSCLNNSFVYSLFWNCCEGMKEEASYIVCMFVHTKKKKKDVYQRPVSPKNTAVPQWPITLSVR